MITGNHGILITEWRKMGEIIREMRVKLMEMGEIMGKVSGIPNRATI
jgi:hypothetical protein